MKYKFKPGVSLLFSETPNTDESLHALAKSRLDYVEVMYASYCNNADWVNSVRKVIDTTSTKINSVHAPFSNEVDISRIDDGGQEFALREVSKAITMAERLGASIVVVHGSAEPISDGERPKRIAQCKSSLDILSKKAQTSGVRLAVEFLPRTCLGNTLEELMSLLDDVPTEIVGLCLDVNHPKGYEQLPDIVKQLGEKIITLHISDYDGIDEKHWMPFKGDIDWGDFANALSEINYGGAFIYEANLDGNTAEEKLANVLSNFQRILTIAENK